MREWFVWKAARRNGPPAVGETIHITYGTATTPPYKMYCRVGIPDDQRGFSMLSTSGNIYANRPLGMINLQTADLSICIDCMEIRESLR